MPYLVRGALIEYKSDFLGPIPNIVIFQFNPESLSRTINIPSRSVTRTAGSQPTETSQAGEQPYENITITAHFNAADQLNIAHPLAVSFGVGPQLAALEKMVYPVGENSGLASQAVDAVADAVSGDDSAPAQPIPRRRYPNVLFIWGATKVLPVLITALSITEKQFDSRLNPIQAEVSLGLSVMTENLPDQERIAKGAAEYSRKVRDIQAAANLGNTATQGIIDLIPF